MELYRYTTFKRLQEIVLKKRLTLVNPFKYWEDTYEGAFYKAINNPQTFNELVSLTHHRNDSNEQLANIKSLVSRYLFIRAQSWCLSDDSIVMWNAYSSNRTAIMLKTSKTLMDEIFKDNLPNRSSVACDIVLPWGNPVSYCIENDADMKKMFIDLFAGISNGIQPYAPLLYKRKAFRYENEYRIFITCLDNSSDITHLKVNNPQEFIEGVMIHPGASKIFVGKVRNFCDENNIVFFGKSPKYEFHF